MASVRITSKTAAQKVKEVPEGEEFYVEFIRRTGPKAGELREMTCIKGVREYAKGTPHKNLSAIRKDANIICVFDTDVAKSLKAKDGDAADFSACYRNINLESIVRIKIQRGSYLVNDFPIREFTASWEVDGVLCERVVKARIKEEAKLALKRELGWKRMKPGVVFI